MHPAMYMTSVVIRPHHAAVSRTVVDDEFLAGWTEERREAWRAWVGGAPTMPAARGGRWTVRPVAASGRRTLHL